MPAYYLNEAMIQLPDLGFEDRTLHMLRAPAPEGGGDIDLVIRRTPMAAGATLRRLVEEHIEGERRALLRYTVIEEREGAVDGAGALDVASRWESTAGPVYQRQTHLAVDDVWLMFLMIAPIASRTTCDVTFDEILSSIQLRERG
jgi:hypothetical protein